RSKRPEIEGSAVVTRRIRFYGKKRGHRHTGSERFGVVGEAIFFTVLLAVGIAGLIAMTVNYIVPEWRANRHFQPTECTVLGTEVKVIADRDSGTVASDKVWYQPLVHIEYEVDGERYRAKTYDAVGRGYQTREKAQRLIEPFRPGDTFACWYDPFDYRRAVLVKGYSWWVYLFFTLPTAFVLIGAIGLIWTAISSGTSLERRAAIVKRATGVDWLEPDELIQRDAFPAIPRHDEIVNSPGTALAYRLPIGTQPGWKLFFLGLVTLFWNVLALIGLFIAVGGNITGARDWLLTALVVPFLLFGVFLIFVFFRQLLVTSGIGMTRVEISDHPLLPGKTYELLISQEGKLIIHSLVARLVCEETATYRQGTDTRTESLRVWDQEVYRAEHIEIQPDRGFQEQTQMRLPEGAMHSLATDHNSVQWMLLVRGDLEHWPDFERRFPIIVHPPTSPPEATA
ncbi:MAG: DUF3592 domain-containing protein, partial [Pirellulales bacterium]